MTSVQLVKGCPLVKQQLAARDWPTVQHYANAKTEIIQAILDEDEAAPL